MNVDDETVSTVERSRSPSTVSLESNASAAIFSISKDWEIDYNELRLEGEIGAGGFQLLKN